MVRVNMKTGKQRKTTTDGDGVEVAHVGLRLPVTLIKDLEKAAGARGATLSSTVRLFLAEAVMPGNTRRQHV